MITKLTRIGDDMAVVLEKPLLDRLGLDENSEVDMSIDGKVLVITPQRNLTREERFRKAADKIDKQYAEVFRRLSDS
jgi:antitoxin component of MazEF toxin-antitoxin module